MDDAGDEEAIIVDKYIELPTHTRAFLSRMGREDVKALADVINSYRRASTVGWFVKWVITAMVGTFMAAVTFGESVKKLISMVSGS